jgi:hypothetical protein
LIKVCNGEISKAILGQTLTTEISYRGSYAASETHQEVRQDLLDMDQRMVAGAFNLLFQWITVLNLPGANSPSFEWYQEEDLQRERPERDALLSKIDGGPRFSQGYWVRTYNLEEQDIIDREKPDKGKAKVDPAVTEDEEDSEEFAVASLAGRAAVMDEGES